MTILDCHTHMPSPGWPGHTCHFSDVAKAVAYLRDTGTDAAISNTWQGVLAKTEEDLCTANGAALALARQYRGFLYPGAVIYPRFPTASLEWLERFRDEGLLWVGELVNYREDACDYTAKQFLDLFEECARHGHVVQLHYSEAILEVAKMFPKMQVVCSHISVEHCSRLAAHPNVWQDISGLAGGLVVDALETAYDAFGADRLLYGTDFTGYEPRCFMLRVQTVVPDLEEQEKVFAGNLVRLLEQVGSKPIGWANCGGVT